MCWTSDLLQVAAAHNQAMLQHQPDCSTEAYHEPRVSYFGLKHKASYKSRKHVAIASVLHEPKPPVHVVLHQYHTHALQ